MNCQDVRLLLLDLQRGQLARDLRGVVGAHLQSCAACAHAAAAERLLTHALDRRLPQHAAPIALKRQLAAAWSTEPRRAVSWWSRWGRSFVPTLAVAAVLLVVMPVYYQRVGGPGEPRSAGMITEAVNDHLRILASQHPLDIESGRMHQVKPWFEGRLDFSPVVHFVGDQDFPLRGGAVGYYMSHKAAVFVFSRRLHEISLFVFQPDGLSWPTTGLQPIGSAEAFVATSRGFHVIPWRQGDLGYALVSDVDPTELVRLAGKLAGSA